MVSPAEFKSRFEAGFPFDRYLATAKPHELAGWQGFRDRVRLTPAQTSLVQGFSRQMPVLVISGTWCGDCVQQVPIFDAIAAANPQRIHLRIIDRDEHLEFAEHFRICGGNRVPTVIFLNEDFEFCGVMGDKTLARFRRQAASALGASCPLPGAPVPSDELAAVTQDWVDQFERVALMLRLSAKLRGRHGD